MKTKFLLLSLLAGLSPALLAQQVSDPTDALAAEQRAQAAQTEPVPSAGVERVAIKERGPHSQRVEVLRDVVNELGETVTVTNSYVQLESGLNYRNEQGEWVASEPKFEITAEGVTAWKGQHRVSLAGNLDTQGAVQLRLPDGRLIEGHVVGLAYYDAATGESVLFAPMKASDGWLMEDNQVVYPDAFEGTQADVRYTYQRHGFAQDIILRATPPDPANYGLDPATTRLEVWTEFTQTPEPELRAGEGRAGGVAEVDEDQTVDFGSMRIGEGRAFALGERTEDGAPVRKRWVKSEQNRTFLIEAVDLPAVATELDALPAPPEEASVRPAKASSRWQALNALPVKPRNPAAETAMLRPAPEHQLVAAYRQPGFVMDYQANLGGSVNNHTFKGDTTYYVSGWTGLYGTTTLEGGAVIKFAKYVAGSVVPQLYVYTSLVSRTSRYRPAVFTAKDDNTVGEVISGSTGNPGTDIYADIAFRLYNIPATTLEHVRFRNANIAATFHSSAANTVFNAQFINCKYVMHNSGSGTLNAHNVLVDNVLPSGQVFSDGGVANAFVGEHLTIHKAPNLRAITSGTTLSLRNSLLVGVNVPTAQGYSGEGNQELSSAAGVFQSAGAGNFYLPPASPFRNAGTSGLNTDLLAELKELTTSVPTALNANFELNTVLAPLVARDGDTPDLGYHYAPLDYLLSERTLSNATLTLTNGVAVGVYGQSGLALGNGANFVSEGLPHRLNQLVRYQNVQEQPMALGYSPAVVAVSPGTLRNNHAGWLGARIVVGSSSIWVGELGRWIVTGNTATHVVKLIQANGTDVAGGSTVITTAGAPAAQFKYAPLATPVMLSANTTYYLMSQETSGGDQWHDHNTPVSPAAGVSFTGSAWAVNGSTTMNIGQVGSYSYMPVDLKFRTGNSGAATGLLTAGSLQTTRPTVKLRFTEVPMMGGTLGDRNLLAATAYYVSSVKISDALLGGARLQLTENQYGTGYAVLAELRNNLLERAEVALHKYYYGSDVNLTANLWNNLFYGGTLSLKYDTHATYNPTWTVKDNHFDNATATQTGTGIASIVKDYNGYEVTPSLGGSNNETLFGFQYASGKLGKWYHSSTALANQGSQSAAAAGLYHHTTVTGQTKDAGTVDIGFHYVAVNAATGLPLDSDNDGQADYFEDADGDNVLDAGETGWSAANVLLSFKNPADGIDWKYLPRQGPPLEIPFQVNWGSGIPAGQVTVQAVSTNQSVVANTQIQVMGSGPDWIVRLFGGVGNGTATITVTASDGVTTSIRQVKVFTGSPVALGGGSVEVRSGTTPANGAAPMAGSTVAPWISNLPFAAANPTRLIVRGRLPLSFGIVFQAPDNLTLAGQSIKRANLSVVGTVFSEPDLLFNQLRIDFASSATAAEMQTCLRAVRAGYPDPLSIIQADSIEVQFSCYNGVARSSSRRELAILPANHNPVITLAGVSGQRIISVGQGASVTIQASIADPDAAPNIPKTVSWQIFQGNAHYDDNVPGDWHVYSKGEYDAELPGYRQLTTVNSLASQMTVTLPYVNDGGLNPYSVYRVRATTSDGLALSTDEIDVYVTSGYSPTAIIRPIGTPLLNQPVTFAADAVGNYTGTPSTVWTVVKPDGSTVPLTSTGPLQSGSFTPASHGRYVVRCQTTFSATLIRSTSATFVVCENPATEADIVFVVDNSGSTLFAAYPSMFNVGFEIQSAFRRALKALNPARHRIGVVSFGNTAQAEAALGESFETCERTVALLVTDKQQQTYLDLGLREAIELFKNDPRKRLADRVIFILTDGYPNNVEAAEYWAAIAKSMGIRIVAVAVPGGSAAALRDVVSRPQDAVQAGFLNVGEIAQRVVSSLCDNSNSAPIASIVPPREVWQGIPTSFHAEAADDGRPVNGAGQPVGMKYTWSVSPTTGVTLPATPHAADIDITFTTAGSYTVNVEVAEDVPSGGLRDFATTTVEVKPLTAIANNNFLVRECVVHTVDHRRPGVGDELPPGVECTSTRPCTVPFVPPFPRRPEVVYYQVFRRASGSLVPVPWETFLRTAKLSDLQSLFGLPLFVDRDWLLRFHDDFSWWGTFSHLPRMTSYAPGSGFDGWSFGNSEAMAWAGSGPFLESDTAHLGTVTGAHYITHTFQTCRYAVVPYGSPWSVSAGPDLQVANLNQNVTISGTSIQDMHSTPVTGYSIAWNLVPGDGQPTGSVVWVSGQTSSLTPTVKFTNYGRYRLSVTISKSGHESTSDEVEVVVGTVGLNLSGTDLVPFDTLANGTVTKVVLSGALNQPVKGAATYSLSATLNGVAQTPSNISWECGLRPVDLLSGEEPTFTATGTDATFTFRKPGIYEIRARSNFGTVRKRVAVNSAPLPDIFGSAGSTISVPRSGATAVAVVPDDDMLPACTPDGVNQVSGVQCLRFTWSSDSVRVKFSDVHSSSPQIILTPLRSGEQPTLMNIWVDVFDGQMTGRYGAPVVDNTAEVPYVTKRLALAPGEEELLISAVSGTGSDQGQVIWVGSGGLKGSIEVMPGGRSLLYRRPVNRLCDAASNELFIYAIQDAAGMLRYESVEIRLMHSLTPGDYDVVEVNGTNYRQGWPLVLSTVNTTYNIAADGNTLFGVKVFRRGCGYGDPVPYTLLAVENVGASGVVSSISIPTEIEASSVAFTVTTGPTANQSTTLRALLRTADNVIVSWPIVVAVAASNPASVMAGAVNQQVNEQVRVGDIVQLSPQISQTGVNNWTWTAGGSDGVFFIDSSTAVSPRVVFTKPGIISVSLSSTQFPTHSYTFTVMESVQRPLYAGQTTDLDLEDLGLTTQATLCFKTEYSQPAGLTLRTAPGGYADGACPGALKVTRFLLDSADPNSGLEPLSVVPDSPGVYVVSVASTASPSSKSYLTFRVAPASEAPVDPAAPLLSVEPMFSLPLTVNGTPLLPAQRYNLSSSPSQPTVVRESGPFEIRGSVQSGTPPANLYYEVRLERIDDGTGHYIPQGPGAVPVQSLSSRPPVPANAASRCTFASFSLRDIPNADYRLSVVLFNSSSLADNTYVALEERYISLRVPRHSGHLEFSRTDAVIGSGESAIKIERFYNSADTPDNESPLNNLVRLGPGWRVSSPLVELKLLETRKSDTATGVSIRDSRSARDIMVVPSGAAEGTRYSFSGYLPDPYWASEDGLGSIRPLASDVFGEVSALEDDPFGLYFLNDGSQNEWVGRYTFILAKGDRRAHDEFDFAGFQWIAPGGARYVFSRGSSEPRPSIIYADGRIYDTETFPGKPYLTEIRLTDGSIIIPQEVSLGGTDTGLDLAVYANESALASGVASRKVRLLYQLSGGVNRRLVNVQEVSPLSGVVTDLVTYAYHASGRLSQVSRNVTLVSETGATTPVTETETYAYADSDTPPNTARPYLLTKVTDTAGQVVLQATYDTSGQLMFATDQSGVIHSYRQMGVGGGDGVPPGFESTYPVDTVYTPVGNRTVARYASLKPAINHANWIIENADSDYVKTENFNPNQSGLPRKTVISAPELTVVTDTTSDGLATVTVPPMTKVIERQYDDEEIGGSAFDTQPSVRSGRRLMRERVYYDYFGSPLGPQHLTEYEYGNSDLPLFTKRHDGRTEHTIYNEANQPIQQGPGSQFDFPKLATTTDYDATTGQIVRTEDGRGLVVTYTYVDGRLDVIEEKNTSDQLVGTQTKHVYAPDNDAGGRWRLGDLLRVIVSGSPGDGTGGAIIQSVTSYEYDSQGRQVVERRFRLPRQITPTPDFNSTTGQLTIALPFNADGSINSGSSLASRVRASVTKQVYDEFGRVRETQEFEEDAGGNPINPSDPIRTTRNFYDALGRLAATIDPYGNKTAYYYDKAGNRIQTVLPDLKTVLRTVYDINRRPILTQKEHEFATAGETLTAASNSGATRTVYDGFGRVFHTETLLKLTLQIVADGTGFYKLTVSSDAYHGNAANRLNRTEQHYNAADELTERLEWRSANGSLETFAVTRHSSQPDSQNASVQLKTTSAGLVRFTRLSDGSLTEEEILEPASQTLEQVSLSLTDAAGRQVATASEVRSGAATVDTHWTHYVYEHPTTFVDTPDVQQVVSPPASRVGTDGKLPASATPAVTTTVYDLKGQATKVTDPAGGIMEKTYDALGRLTSVKQELGATDPLTLYRYDEAGNLVWRRDAEGRVVFDEFDYLSRRTKRTSPTVSNNSGVETWTHDYVNAGAWKRRLIANDLATWPIQQDFDSRGRLITETPQAPTPPDSAANYGNAVYQFAYVRLTALPTWIPGAIASQVAGKRTITDLVNGSSTTTRTNTLFYDGAGRLRARGTQEGTICYTYEDATGRLSRIQAYRAAYTVGSNGAETWGGDSNNGPAATTKLPDVDLTYAYDYAGRLVTVTDNKLTTSDKVTTYVYDAGRLLGQRYPNGVTTVFKYDPLAEVSAIEFNRKDSAGFTLANLLTDAQPYWSRTPKASLAYTRDYSGQRRRSLDALPLANTADTSGLKRQFQHKYDLAHRLDTEWVADSLSTGTDFNVIPPSGNRATLAYAMNLVGNRGSRTKSLNGSDPIGGVAATVSTYAYDGQDRATTVGGTSPTWDKKDNALAPGNGKTYQWDRRNRLTASTTGGTTTTLGYDAEGLRVFKQVGSGTPTRYLVDTLNPTGYGQVLVDYTGDGTSRQPVRTYTYGLDLISQRTVSGNLVEFFSTDVLGTTRFLTKFDPGTTAWDGQLGELTTQTFNYDAYGTLVGSTTATAYLYTGEQWDADVGAYYLRARWYLPEWGRFLSRDTYDGMVSDPLSQNRLLYASASPVNRIDPSGHWDFIQTQAVLGQMAVQAAKYSPVAGVLSRYASRMLNGIQNATTLAQTIVARGGDLIATEMRVADAAGKVIGRFRADLIVQLSNRVTALIESKGVRWDLFSRAGSGWSDYVAQLERQAVAFGNASQTVGVQIQQRIIVFSSSAPAGLKDAEAALLQLCEKAGYDKVFFGQQAFDRFLQGL